MPEIAHCKYCDITMADSYERTMGMYCEQSPTGLHAASEPSESHDNIPEPAPATAMQSPLDRFIALIAQGNLIREEPQTAPVPLLRRAEVVAHLYQAQALQQIAGELTVIREALKGLPDALASLESVAKSLEDCIDVDDATPALRVAAWRME